MFRGGARIVVRGDIGQNFIYDFLSNPVLQWRRQNFGWNTFSKSVLIKDFLKNFEKFRKILQKKFNKFSKIFQK